MSSTAVRVLTRGYPNSPSSSHVLTRVISQISPKYITSLRCNPRQDDNYSEQILRWREMGFTKIPGTQVPLDNIGVLTKEGQKAWANSRYCDWVCLEQQPGGPAWCDARAAAKGAREAFEAQLAEFDATGDVSTRVHAYTHEQSGQALQLEYSDEQMRADESPSDDADAASEATAVGDSSGDLERSAQGADTSDGGGRTQSQTRGSPSGSSGNEQESGTRTSNVVCLKAPKQSDALLRAEFTKGREAWVRHRLGPEGVYVGAPQSMGEWFYSPSVKAGSMFANPFRAVDDSAESMRLYRAYVEARASPDATTGRVIELLPTKLQALARKRHVDGVVHETEGKSVAHLQLDIVGNEFRAALSALRGKTLGCWCDGSKITEGLCHATVIESAAGALCEHPYEYPNEAWTVTWGDVAMNEVEMQRIGEMAEQGVSVDRLQEIKDELAAKGMECVLIDLRRLLPESERDAAPEAAVLVVKAGVCALSGDPQGEAKLLAELRSMPIDKKAYAAKHKKHNGVFNKKNRYNNLLGDEDLTADYARKQGSVVNCSKYPVTSKLRAAFATLLRVAKLYGETNDYYDASMCGIGWREPNCILTRDSVHQSAFTLAPCSSRLCSPFVADGDRERKIVAGVRLGPGATGMPLKFLWFRNQKPFGAEGRILLDAGDVYFMSEKAVGFDWRTKKHLTLRHAAGADKYSSVGTLKALKTDGAAPPPVVQLFPAATAAAAAAATAAVQS